MSLFDFALSSGSLGWLYRVQTSDSATKFQNGALTARGTRYPPHTVASRADWFLQEHFSWSSREPSPFISLFGSEKHARKWAASLAKKRPGMVCNVYGIDPVELGHKTMFDASVLAERLHVNLPQSARSQVNGEFLVLHAIPARAICWIARFGATIVPPPPPPPPQLSDTYEDWESYWGGNDCSYGGLSYDYSHQDQAMDRLASRLAAMTDEELGKCGAHLIDPGRAIARLLEGLKSRIDDNA